MEFRVLGPLDVLDASGRSLALSGTKERTILAALLVARGEVVSTDRLIDILWPGEPPAKPANALQARVSALRRTLGASDLIVTSPPGYRLAVEKTGVDALRFEALLGEARAAHGDSSISVYEEALSLFRGAPFIEFAYEDFARAEIARLEELRASAREERIQLMLDTGRHGEVLGELEGVVVEHPLRERGWGQLMVALYRSGRQADALRAYREASTVLGEELGIEPSADLRRLEEAILVQDPDLDLPTPQKAAPGHNLPARITSLIGRADDVGRVVLLLDSHRLITLTGPGGVGKTSLATAIGHEAVSRFRDGVWLVELAGVDDPSLVPVVIASDLGVEVGDRPTLDLVCEVLREREVLVLLDNCEHLVDSVAEAAVEILQQAPGAKIIATSREPLGVMGEILWPTRPLPAPTQPVDPSALESYDAVRLFVERARAALADFVLDDTAAPAVADICRRLDGLPLAIELAAARVRSMPVVEIASRLDDRFRLLVRGSRTVVPRQQTLEAAIGWSYALLEEEEKELFRRLAVFVGGWTLAAAEALSATPESTLDLLDRLVDRSLVGADHSGSSTRYSMLETIRAFASRELVVSGEQEEAALQHVRWYLSVAESGDPRGADQAEWVRRLSAEHENLRAALGQALAHGAADLALRLGGRLGWWWFFGNRDEGRSVLDQLLDATEGHTSPWRISALEARARLDLFGPTRRSLAVAEEALDLATSLGDEAGAAYAKVLVALSGAYGSGGAPALRLLEEAVAAVQISGDKWGEAFAGFQRMEVVAHGGDLRAAIAEGEGSLALFRRTGDPWAISAALAHLARYRRLIGDDEAAEETAAEALEVAGARGLPHTIQYVMTTQAYLRSQAGDQPGALRIFGEALALSIEVGNQVGVAANENGMAEAHLAAAQLDRAREYHRRALEDFRRLDLAGGVAYSLTRLGLAEETAARWGEAGGLHAEALDLAGQTSDAVTSIPAFEGLGRVAAFRGDFARARRFLAVGAALRVRTGLAANSVEVAATEAARASVAGQLGSAAETIPSGISITDLEALAGWADGSGGGLLEEHSFDERGSLPEAEPHPVVGLLEGDVESPAIGTG